MYRSFKDCLHKQIKKEGSRVPNLAWITRQVKKVLITLNQLNISFQKTTAYQRHFQQKAVLPNPLVCYRQLPDKTWLGPIPLLTWGRGYAAVLAPTGPLWIPAQCVRPAKDVMASSPEPNTGNEAGDSSDSTTSLSLSPSQLTNNLGRCEKPNIQSTDGFAATGKRTYTREFMRCHICGFDCKFLSHSLPLFPS